MSTITITLTDVKDEDGKDRILTRVEFDRTVPPGKSTRSEIFGLALADLVHQSSAATK